MRCHPLLSGKAAAPAVADAADAMDAAEYGDQFMFTENEASPMVKPQVSAGSK